MTPVPPRITKLMLFTDDPTGMIRSFLLRGKRTICQSYLESFGACFGIVTHLFKCREFVFQIWQTKHRQDLAIKKLFFSGITACIIAFDRNKVESFGILPLYFREIQTLCQDIIPILILGFDFNTHYSAKNKIPSKAGEELTEIINKYHQGRVEYLDIDRWSISDVFDLLAEMKLIRNEMKLDYIYPDFQSDPILPHEITDLVEKYSGKIYEPVQTAIAFRGIHRRNRIINIVEQILPSIRDYIQGNWLFIQHIILPYLIGSIGI
ncbi:MAG: hypothetical protein ACFFBD_14830 [Candidatus Hodarchaeota archaeon]